MYKYRHLFLALILIWMVVIFVFSQQGHDSSTGQSNAVINTIQGISGHELPEVIVRKSAHAIIYFTLGILALLTTVSYRIKLKKAIFISLTIVVLYAISDEIHQLLIPGRSGQASDVLLDSTAGVTGIVAVAAMRKQRQQ